MTGNLYRKEIYSINHRNRHKILSFALVFFLILATWNQSVLAKDEGSVEMNIDSTNLTIGVSTNLSIVFTNASKPEIYEIAGIENFDVVSTGQSSSTQIINGNTTKQKQISYTIVPKSEGTFELTGNVSIDGVDKQTNTITITVSKSQNTTADGSSDLYVKTVLSTESAYVGEKIVLTYELYSRYNIEQFGFLDSITFDNSLLEEIPEDNLSANYVTINGNKYVKYEAKKYIITPIKAGIIDIPAFQFQANITDGGFFSQSKPMYLQSEAKTVQIQAIPQLNQPENYKGLVGSITIESSYDKTEVSYGEPITLHVTIKGNANLDTLSQIINEKDYPEFTIYETDQPIQSDYSNNTIVMTKESEIIIVPKEIGELSFEPKAISYFDTASGTFKEALIPALALKVDGEKPTVNNGNSNSSSNGNTASSKITINQTAYGEAQDLSDYFVIRKNVVYFGLGIPAFMVILLILLSFIKKYKNRSPINNKAKARIEQLKKANGLSEQYEILCEIVKEVYGFSLKSSNTSQREAMVNNKHILNSLNHIVTFFEYGRYHQQNEPVGKTEQMTEQMTELVKEVYMQKG